MTGIKTKEQMWSRLADRREDAVKLCSELIGFPSVNPPGDTRKVADYICRFIEKLQPSLIDHIKVIEPALGCRGLLVAIGSGRPGSTVTLNAHLDVFPVEDDDTWQLPPFGGTVQDGRIHGRGACDMKAGVAAALTVFLLFAAERLVGRGKLHLMLVADEETGGQWGTNWVLENLPEWRGDVCIIGEPSGTEVVRLGEKGQLWLRLSAQGESYHGGLADGREPIAQVVEAIHLIVGLAGREGKTPPDLQAVLEDSRTFAWTPQFRERTWLLDHLSVNVGRISGGIKVNVAPRDCIAELDLRLPFGMQPAALLEEIKGLIASSHLDIVCESQLAYPCPSTYTPPDHPLVRAARTNACQAVGRDVPAVFAPTFTDARFFRLRGIPAIVYGPRPYSMGGLNEYVTVQDLERVIQVHAGIVWDYLADENA